MSKEVKPLFGEDHYEEYKEYQRWYRKVGRKGMALDSRSSKMYDSYEVYAKRYRDLQLEKASDRPFEGSIQNEIKNRSFKGGTNKQVEAYYQSVKDMMDDLKDTNEELYHQLNMKYGFEELGGMDLGDLERRGAYLMNKDRRSGNAEDMGWLDLMVAELTDAGMVFIFNSPTA